MHISSREVTYRSAVEQIFFEDGTELVITMGAPAEGGGDIDIEYDWVNGKPDWADYLNESTLVNYEGI